MAYWGRYGLQGIASAFRRSYGGFCRACIVDIIVVKCIEVYKQAHGFPGCGADGL